MLREKFATAYRKEISEGTACSWKLYEQLRFLESFINLVKNDSKTLMHSSNDSLESSSVAKSSPLDEHALIRLIKQHPVLYNKKHDDFHSASQRRKAWESISSKAKFDVSILQKRWRVIRDRFVRDLRKTQYNEESNLNCSSFFRDMLFLARHIRSKNYAVEAHLENENDLKYTIDANDYGNNEDSEWTLQLDNVDESYQYIDETEEIEQVYEEEISQSEYIEEEASDNEVAIITLDAAPIEEIDTIHENWEKSEADAARPSSSQKRRASASEEELKYQQENKKRLKSQSPARTLELTDDKDEDMAFGNTIGCMLKKIPQHLKTSVKLKLLTSLAEFEAQHKLNI